MHHRQRGLAMIEILGALLIAALLMGGLSTMVDTGLEEAKAQRAAQYQAQMTKAAAGYLADQYGALAVPAKVGQTLVITPAMLQAAGALPPGMAAANPYGQSACLLVRPRAKSPAAPAAIVLDALVVGEGPASAAIPDRVLAFAASGAGAGAGFITSRDASQALSVAGSWTLNAGTTPTLANFIGAKCGATAAGGGSLVTALFFDGPGGAADFLYRDAVPGMPELNRINVPLGFKNAVLAGAACAGAAIAMDGDQNLMVCNKDSKTWKRIGNSWKEPVADFAALPTSDDDGDVRMVLGLRRAFTFSKAVTPGGAWVALAVDQNGNMTVPGELGARDVRAVNVYATQDVNATRDLVAGRDVQATAGGVYMDHMSASSWAYVDSLTLNSRHGPGEACHIPFTQPDGQTAYLFAIGTMVLDRPGGGPPVMLVCSGTNPGDAHFVYADGGATRK